MNDLITDIKNLELETIKNLRNSKSANTLRAYQSDYNDFSLFCLKNGFQSMPTQPKILALYIMLISLVVLALPEIHFLNKIMKSHYNQTDKL